MFFEELRITNFKRFAGTNIFPLKGEGNVTIIAAKNGVGKTTVLDAFNLVLHGAQGIKQRYGKAGFSFDDWVRKNSNNKFDYDGEISSSGKINELILNQSKDNFEITSIKYSTSFLV